MEKLSIDRGKFNQKRMIGLLWIIAALILFLTGKQPLGQKQWLAIIAFGVIGILHFTPLVGSGKYEIVADNGYLTITWYSWIRKEIIPETEIEGIVLGTKGVGIKRKGKKDLKIELYSLKREEKTQVYDFFTSYAKSRNLI